MRLVVRKFLENIRYRLLTEHELFVITLFTEKESRCK